jgi:hypothetical protein
MEEWTKKYITAIIPGDCIKETKFAILDQAISLSCLTLASGSSQHCRQ